MSSLIRSPKVNGQSRILAIEKIAPVNTGSIETNNDKNSKQARKVLPDTEKYGFDGLAEKDDTITNGYVNEEPKSHLEKVSNNYSQEVEQQVAESRSRLTTLSEELETLKKSIGEEREKAKKSGYEDGYKKGQEDADSVLTEKLQQLDALIEGITNGREQGYADNEDMLVEIVFAAISKLLGDILQSKEGVLAAVRHSTSFITNRDKLIFRVSERDYQLLKNEKHRLTSLGDTGEVEVIPDQQVQLGGCILETSAGSLDSRLEVQLKNLMDTFKNVSTGNKSSI